MQISFQRKNGYYRLQLQNVEIKSQEEKDNLTIYYDKQKNVVAIDFYPQSKF